MRPARSRDGVAAPRVAQYLRMSTEHQRYSTEQQSAAIELYAMERGYQIVATYTDSGISGLELKKRKGLQALLADVLAGAPGFELILVYDVSRWGRFQNPDQSAHYEFICAEAGVRIEYCAEQFDNDGSMAASILKNLKRVMAAEYSRDLSAKVTRGQRHLAMLGYWQGGPPGLGLRRLMVDPQGAPRQILERGEYKSLQSFRTVLTTGPPEEVALVRRIFSLFVDHQLPRQRIVRLLNAEGLRSDNGAQWSWTRLNWTLTNPAYVGDYVFGKTRARLGSGRTAMPRETWVRIDDAFEGIVERLVFEAAQALMAAEITRRSREDIIELLRAVLAEHGFLSTRLLARIKWAPKCHAILNRFGSVGEAFAAAGYTGEAPRPGYRPAYTEQELLEHLASLVASYGHVTRRIITDQKGKPSVGTYLNRFGTMEAACARIGHVWMGRRRTSGPVGRAQAAAVAAIGGVTRPQRA